MSTEALRNVLHVLMVVSAICATAFPVLYAFSPWYRSLLGRALMIYAVAFAIILDVTAYYALADNEDARLKLYVYFIAFVFVASASVFLTIQLYVINHKVRENEEKSHGRRFTDRPSR